MKSVSEEETWGSAFAARTDLKPYGDNAIGLFALALRFNVEDLASIAADAITDGSDDKKIDIIYIDDDEHVAVVAQCYLTATTKSSAPANKASDLNTAVGWLLQVPLEKVPSRLRSSVQRLRDSLQAGSVSEICFWYTHNLPESKNVADELTVVTASATAALKSSFPAISVRVSAAEIGSETFADWYSDSLSPILVDEEFTVKVLAGFEIHSEKWDACVTTLPANFLHKQYKKHKAKLFSANVRDYLGSRKSDQNINHGIKQTAEKSPANFWVFNNGLTVLVHDYSLTPEKSGASALKIRGISIVNGAQTTGAIGSLRKAPDLSAFVPVRLIKTANRDVIYDIIRYNNSQNKVTAPDFRSTDRVQKRLKEEMANIPGAEYEGGRRGGHEDIIRRRVNLLPSHTVGQALAAFHGDAVTAYHEKSNIWISDNLYARYFNDSTTAAHIIYCYSLLRAVEARKHDLLLKSKAKPESLTATEQKQLEFFRNRGATYLLVSAIAACVETFSGKKVSDKLKLSFRPSVSPAMAQTHWKEMVLTTAPLCTHLDGALSDGLKNLEQVRKAVATFQSLVEVTAQANSSIYKEFASKTVFK